MNVEILDTAIPEVKIIVPRVFGDVRGYFFESWTREKYEAVGIRCDWMQDNESKSRFGVLRGLHYQAAPYTQAKLVRVMQGAVLDVAVDIRRGSPTFGRHVAVELSDENKYQIFVPRGFAHGFVVLSKEVLFAYKCDNRYMPSHERGIAFDDPALGIDWKVGLDHYILSEKDTRNPLLKDAELFDYQTGEYLQ